MRQRREWARKVEVRTEGMGRVGRWLRNTHRPCPGASGCRKDIECRVTSPSNGAHQLPNLHSGLGKAKPWPGGCSRVHGGGPRPHAPSLGVPTAATSHRPPPSMPTISRSIATSSSASPANPRPTTGTAPARRSSPAPSLSALPPLAAEAPPPLAPLPSSDRSLLPLDPRLPSPTPPATAPGFAPRPFLRRPSSLPPPPLPPATPASS